MIQTGNPEIDAVIVELEGQIMALTEQNALKAGALATVRVQMADLTKRVEALAKPGGQEPPIPPVDH
jgi:hypothetical protein